MQSGWWRAEWSETPPPSTAAYVTHQKIDIRPSNLHPCLPGRNTTIRVEHMSPTHHNVLRRNGAASATERSKTGCTGSATFPSTRPLPDLSLLVTDAIHRHNQHFTYTGAHTVITRMIDLATALRSVPPQFRFDVPLTCATDYGREGRCRPAPGSSSREERGGGVADQSTCQRRPGATRATRTARVDEEGLSR